MPGIFSVFAYLYYTTTSKLLPFLKTVLRPLRQYSLILRMGQSNMHYLKLIVCLFFFCSVSIGNYAFARRIVNKPFFENENQYLRSSRHITSSVGEAIGCKVAPTASMYMFLNRICEDCFNIYRDADLYHMCR